MEKIVIEVIGVTGASVALMIILIYISKNWFIARLKSAIKYEYERELHELDDELRRKTDTELQKLGHELHIKSQLEILKINSEVMLDVEINKIKSEHYSSKQFELYNQLWSSLCDLKHSMLSLWEHISNDRLIEFSENLERTVVKLEKSALIIEESHYNDLMEILNTFAYYEFGKLSLIEIRKEKDSGAEIIDQEIRDMVRTNNDIRNRLLNYLPKMKKCLQEQIKGERR